MPEERRSRRSGADGGEAEVAHRLHEEQEKGYSGTVPDPTPNANYSVAGVTSGAPTPETSRQFDPVTNAPVNAAASMMERDAPPAGASANEVLDFLIDTIQDGKNLVVNGGVEIAGATTDVINEINGLADDLIDRLQKLKG